MPSPREPVTDPQRFNGGALHGIAEWSVIMSSATPSTSMPNRCGGEAAASQTASTARRKVLRAAPSSRRVKAPRRTRCPRPWTPPEHGYPKDLARNALVALIGRGNDVLDRRRHRFAFVDPLPMTGDGSRVSFRPTPVTSPRRGRTPWGATTVAVDPHARYFGAELGERSLVPAGEARLGEIRFEKWLGQAVLPQR